MCLVEIEGAANLAIACATPLLNNMRVRTLTERLREARENILEFLLLNHPLDCPICDQAGECDLQDLSKMVGTDRGRFYELIKDLLITLII